MLTDQPAPGASPDRRHDGWRGLRVPGRGPVEDRASAAALAAIAGAGLLIRLPGFTSTGLFRADAWVALTSRADLGTALRMCATAPGFTLAERFWIGLNPGSSLWAQVPPFLIGVAGVIAFFGLARF